MSRSEQRQGAEKWRQALKLLQAMHISTHAAHACFFIILSLFPTLVLIFGFLRYTALQPEDLLDLISGLLPEALLPHAWNLIRSAYENTSKLVVSLSALTALWSAGRGVYGLQAGLNAVFSFQESRSWLQRRLLCTAYTFLFILVLLLTLVLQVFGNTMAQLLQRRTTLQLWTDLAGFRFILLVLAQTLLFCAIFRYLPGKGLPFREGLPGALFACFGWMSTSSLFSLYVDYFPRYANIFGSVYAVALAGFWLYICISIVLYGAVLNRILRR